MVDGATPSTAAAFLMVSSSPSAFSALELKARNVPMAAQVADAAGFEIGDHMQWCAPGD